MNMLTTSFQQTLLIPTAANGTKMHILGQLPIHIKLVVRGISQMNCTYTSMYVEPLYHGKLVKILEYYWTVTHTHYPPHK